MRNQEIPQQMLQGIVEYENEDISEITYRASKIYITKQSEEDRPTLTKQEFTKKRKFKDLDFESPSSIPQLDLKRLKFNHTSPRSNSAT